jgi:hypothetical protein
MEFYPSTGRIMGADYLAIYWVKAGRLVKAWAEQVSLTSLVQLDQYRSPASRPSSFRPGSGGPRPTIASAPSGYQGEPRR